MRSLIVVLVLLVDQVRAYACGCFSPPAVTEGDYAINQSAEQIVFEVEPGWVTAHVSIQYAGDPSQFAWIVPVPEVPELGISPTSAFGLLDKTTAPYTRISVEDICPQTEWACFYEGHSNNGGCVMGPAASAGETPGHFPDGGTPPSTNVPQPPPVNVIAQQTVGDYQTITFRASEANAAVQWLRDNGFIVNATTSIYMESYIQENMVFVAAKLQAGAGASAIKPLRMRYRAAYPSIPLVLSAVAAQPHLTVTAFIYSAKPFTAMSHPVVTLDDSRLAIDRNGRSNYPMLLARTIDEAGGDAFVIEYSGAPTVAGLNGTCCSGTWDMCNVANDNKCQCPGTELDKKDCEALPDLNAGIDFLKTLSTKYPWLTRITTRISPEEMLFDPTYVPDAQGTFSQVQLSNQEPSLAACSSAIMDQGAYAAIEARQQCSTVYCGPNSQCVVTANGAACACAENTVAQQFTDLDGKPSVTCVPRTPPVDLRAGGQALPDACANTSCGAGTCIDRNGIAVCACDADTAASPGFASPTCSAITQETHSPGAENYTHALKDLAVCAPPPPACGSGTKYMRVDSPRVGIDCGNANPPPDKQTDDGYSDSSGCCQETRSPPPILFVFGVLVLASLVRRRR